MRTSSGADWLWCDVVAYIVTGARPVASHPGGGGGLNLDRWNTGADTGFPEGGGEDIHKHPLPIGYCPRDVIRPPEN